jgi:uncharacterized protein
MKMSLKGKNVLVTGSSMGIGKGLSECFARQGANLVLADLECRKEQLEAWAEELRRGYGIRTWTFCGDLTDLDGPEKLHDEVMKAVPEVHVLVNNAGVCWFGRFSKMPLERMNTMVMLNCMAYAKMSRLFLPAMIRRNEGGILNISSVSAFQPVPTLGLYAATKAFTQSFTEAMRAELPKGSRVVISTLNPPFTRTHLIQDAGVPQDYIPMMMSFMGVEEVVTSGVKAFGKGKGRFVPGLHNRIFYLGIVKLIPHGLLIALSRIITLRLSSFIPASVLSPVMKIKFKRNESV